MSFSPNNVYILYTSAVPDIVLTLPDSSTLNGVRCVGCTEYNTVNTFDQQWLIREVHGQQGVYTLCSLNSGTYLDLSNGSNKNGTTVQGWSKATSPNEKNQYWKITQVGSNFRLQNVTGGTYLDLKEWKPVDGTTVHAWEYAAVATQEWRLHRVSRTAEEIHEMIHKNPYIGCDFKNYLQDGLYIVPNKTLRDEVYKGTRLKDTKWRDEIFDCDDFAFVAKSEVSKWGNEVIRADGVAILFGVMFGKNQNGVHAYNWYLNKDLNNIIFFEPQTGEEMVDSGYKAFFGLF